MSIKKKKNKLTGFQWLAASWSNFKSKEKYCLNENHLIWRVVAVGNAAQTRQTANRALSLHWVPIWFFDKIRVSMWHVLLSINTLLNAIWSGSVIDNWPAFVLYKLYDAGNFGLCFFVFLGRLSAKVVHINNSFSLNPSSWRCLIWKRSFDRFLSQFIKSTFSF